MVKNIVLCGVGGQGILLAAKIIARAAGTAGFQVAANEIHGMAQRGGSVTAQIRYGENFFSPLVAEGGVDLLGAMEAGEALRYAHWLNPHGFAVVSALKIIPVTVSSGKASYPADVETRLKRVFPQLFFRDFAADSTKLGTPKLANTVMLGAISARLDEIPAATWRDAVAGCVKPAYVDLNLKAFEIGRKSAL